MSLVPLADRRPRMPRAGAMRMGERIPVPNKPGKFKPVTLDTWRFTAPRPDDLEIIASRYGGQVRPWRDPDGKSEDRYAVDTDVSEVDVWLPDDCLGDGTLYELWKGKGWERKCNGVVATVPVEGPDGRDELDVPCVCQAEANQPRAGKRDICKPTTRIDVLLPRVTLRGVWRCLTHSDLAVDELASMVRLILAQQGAGISRATLRIDHRQSRGGRNHFALPVLGSTESLEGLAAGAARLARHQLEEADRPALLAGDDVAVDAEIVTGGYPSNHNLDERLAELTLPQRTELSDWWKAAQLPHRNDLTGLQECEILDELDRREW